MSTTPVVPTPSIPKAAPVSTVTKIEQDLTWVKLHIFTVLLLTGTLVGSGLYGFNKFENLMEAHDARMAAEQQQAEGVSTATTTALLAQLQAQRTADTARDARAQTTILNLIQQMKTEHAQTAKQLTADATLNAKDAAARLVTQTKSAPTDAVASGDTVIMTLPLTRAVVADLDELPQAQADVTNLQGQLTAEITRETDANSQLTTADQTIAADKVELIDTIKADNAACKVQVDKQASKDRKRSIWLTILGIATGVTLRSAF